MNPWIAAVLPSIGIASMFASSHRKEEHRMRQIFDEEVESELAIDGEKLKMFVRCRAYYDDELKIFHSEGRIIHLWFRGHAWTPHPNVIGESLVKVPMESAALRQAIADADLYQSMRGEWWEKNGKDVIAKFAEIPA